MTPVAVAMRWPPFIILMTTLSFKPPLQHVCLLRLSAIGDTCHALAALRAFQAAWPETRFTWIIGKVEAKLMREILPEIEFITFDKAATLRELWRLRALLRGRRFDLLLDMQLSFRASLISRLVARPHQAGVRSAAGARAAVAVHQCANCARGTASTCWTHSWASPVPAASSPSAAHWDISPAAELRSTTHAASSPPEGPRCSSARVPAMPRAIGRQRGTPRSPIMPPRCMT